jgi:hypothetical protein
MNCIVVDSLEVGTVLVSHVLLISRHGASPAVAMLAAKNVIERIEFGLL